jgi:hypothetical protein
LATTVLHGIVGVLLLFSFGLALRFWHFDSREFHQTATFVGVARIDSYMSAIHMVLVSVAADVANNSAA